MAADRVDLPVPFGPIIAATSPVLRVRLTPFKISFPSISTWRSLISKTDMVNFPFFVTIIYLISIAKKSQKGFYFVLI